MAKKKKTKKKKSFLSARLILGLLFLLIFMIMFLPTTFLFVIGMLPTFVVAAIDDGEGKNKTFTIGSMNFAGCFPYLTGLWMSSNSMDKVMDYLSDPKTIIVIYTAAAMGYFINWGITMGVSSILVQRSHIRIKKIEEQKQQMEERWGSKVNGKYNLNESGFLIETPPDEDVSTQ